VNIYLHLLPRLRERGVLPACTLVYIFIIRHGNNFNFTLSFLYKSKRLKRHKIVILTIVSVSIKLD
jgi:hypothetical protein